MASLSHKRLSVYCDGAIEGAAYLHYFPAVPSRVSWCKVEHKGLGLTQRKLLITSLNPVHRWRTCIWQSLTATSIKRHATVELCSIALRFIMALVVT